MRQVWLQQFLVADGTVRWRHSNDTPPSSRMISSPYDVEAHYARKRSTRWIGYCVHLTETCDDECPRLITHVETVDAPEGDADAVPPIHEALASKDLLTSRHLVDTGYVEAKLLVSESRTHGVDLYGPTRSDYHWQSNAGLGFAAMQFAIDWDKQEATCPAGKTSVSWTPAIDRGDNEVVKIKFSCKDCRPCPSRFDCTTSKRHERRTITIRTREAYEALQAARARQQTEEFKTQYGVRAGVEGTISQGVRAFGLRRGRYSGFAKTMLQHLMTGAAINLARLDDWIAGVPREITRLSAFQLLLKAPSSA
jgi:transposase